MAQSFELNRSKTLRAEYLICLPRSYDEDAGKQWPLILFLHGAGERGNDVWKAATYGPPSLIREGRELPFVIVTPLCPSGKRWSNEILFTLIDEIEEKYRIDPGRIYLTGLSMGGYGTWSLGLAEPARFAALAPICGGGEGIDVYLAANDKPEAFRSLGVWAFHGAKDPVVPVEESERMVRFMKQGGCEDVRLTIYPDAQHDVWTETYHDPALYEWFLQHDRTVKHERGK